MIDKCAPVKSSCESILKTLMVTIDNEILMYANCTRYYLQSVHHTMTDYSNFIGSSNTSLNWTHQANFASKQHLYLEKKR